MSFRSITLLWVLTTIPLLVLFLITSESRRARIARRFASERLRGIAKPARALRPWLLTLAMAAALVALAGPYAGVTLLPLVAREANRVLVLDVSQSMDATDVGTTRLSAAKAIAMRLAEQQEGRIALVVFEASPEVVSPLTTDVAAVTALIDTLVTGELGQPGSDIGSAIIGALRLIEADGSQKPDIVLISDGEDQGARLMEAIQRAKSRGIEVSTILIGSPQGSIIPTPRGPLRDSTGDTVTTYARPEVMTRIARETGGRPLQNPFGAPAIEPLLQGASAGAPRETHAQVPIDRFQWPLALSFLALVGASVLNRGAE